MLGVGSPPMGRGPYPDTLGWGMPFSAPWYLWLAAAASDEPQSLRQSQPSTEKVQDHNCDLEWCRGSPRGIFTPCAAPNVLPDLWVAVPVWPGPRGAKQVAERERDTQVSHVCWQQLREGETTGQESLP